MGKWEHVAINSVVAHEQPPREALVDVRAAICQCRLRGLRREGMDIAQKQLIECLTLLNRLQECGSLNPVTGTSELDVLVMRTLVRTEQ